MEYTAHKISLLMKVFKFFANVCQRIQNGIFFMLEINFLIVDVLDFEDVTTLADASKLENRKSVE